MTDRLPLDLNLAQVMAWYYGMFPPVQCAPAIGVHQKCEHSARPRAHFTIDRDGTIRPDTRTDPT